MWQSFFLGLIVALLLYIALKKDSSTSPSNTSKPIPTSLPQKLSISIPPQYSQYPQYYPQSLGMPRNVYLDYVNDLYYGYYPGYNYTWDSVWNKKSGHKGQDKQSINIENKPHFSINQNFQSPTLAPLSPSIPTLAPLSPSMPTFAPLPPSMPTLSPIMPTLSP